VDKISKGSCIGSLGNVGCGTVTPIAAGPKYLPSLEDILRCEQGFSGKSLLDVTLIASSPFTTVEFDGLAGKYVVSL
jgi:hypothetical protein